MNLNLKNEKHNKIENNEFLEKFTKDLNNYFDRFCKKIKENVMFENIELTNEEEYEFEKREFKFLQEFFSKELENISKNEIFIVTNKYENDEELNRYKITQYKDNLECKYIALGEELPENVKLGDVIRKIDGKYVYDEETTKYLNDSLNQIKQDIINNRK